VVDVGEDFEVLGLLCYATILFASLNIKAGRASDLVDTMSTYLYTYLYMYLIVRYGSRAEKATVSKQLHHDLVRPR
jgi:hypothetical protein